MFNPIKNKLVISILVISMIISAIGIVKAQSTGVSLKELIAETVSEKIINRFYSEDAEEGNLSGSTSDDWNVGGDLNVTGAGGNVMVAEQDDFGITNVTSSNGLLVWSPDNDVQILGITADLVGQTATGTFTLQCGIIPYDNASTTIDWDDGSASSSASLISQEVTTNTQDMFTINGSNWATGSGPVFATSASSSEAVVCGVTSTIDDWKGLCGGQDSCANTSSSVDFGNYKIFYIND